MSRYYRLLLDDYSAASFTSFDKDYFGTLEQIDSFFQAIKSDEDTESNHTLEMFHCTRSPGRIFRECM